MDRRGLGFRVQGVGLGVGFEGPSRCPRSESVWSFRFRPKPLIWIVVDLLSTTLCTMSLVIEHWLQMLIVLQQYPRALHP